MNEHKQILINQNYIGWRYDAAIADLLSDYSRTKISTLIKQGDISINGKKIIGKERIKQKIFIDLIVQNNTNQKWQADDIKLDIIDEDEHILVINKPSGLVTHPGAANLDKTLANALLHYLPQLRQVDRAGIVHRLDKETSGLLVVAKTPLAQQQLIKQLQNHQVKRQYLAICYGHIIAGDSINKALGRHPKDRTKYAVLEIGGKDAITHYRIATRFANHTLVKVKLETGRTHQIRVHLAYIGHSLVADKVYGKGVYFAKNIANEVKMAIINMTRHCLHAQKLELIHPQTKQLRKWQSKMPTDMENFLQKLTKYDLA